MEHSKLNFKDENELKHSFQMLSIGYMGILMRNPDLFAEITKKALNDDTISEIIKPHLKVFFRYLEINEENERQNI